MTRVAAVDCGTNSVRLLVADVDPATNTLVDVVREMRIVRLGEGVDRTGRLAPAALDRTQEALQHYAGLIERTGCERLRFVATSASRDAENSGDFVDLVQSLLGVEPEVVTGATEAELSFTGATRELAGGDLAQPFCVVDIGGGSTEFVLGADAPTQALSVDIGCVRLAERHFADDPPTQAQVDAAVRDIDAALDEVAAAVPVAAAATLVGLAGSVTTVAGIALGLERYDSDAIHHSRLTRAQVEQTALMLRTTDRAGREQIGVLHPGRVDVIAAGALVLARLMQRFDQREVVVSEHDILDGIAWSLVSHR